MVGYRNLKKELIIQNKMMKKRIPFEKCERGNKSSKNPRKYLLLDIFLLKIMKINEIEESNPIIILFLLVYKLL